MGVTNDLVDLATTLRREDLPDAVVNKIQLHLLDQLGAELAGSTLPWNKIVRDYAIDQARPGPATVVGAGHQTGTEWAAFANATAGHGFEMDDYHTSALSHPGCVAVPTVLAMAEQTGAAGDEVLVALVLGFETIVRIGLAVQPSMIYDRGFHETCTEGVFGAALAAGRLRGLSSSRLVHALGIAGSHASGTTEYSQSGGEVKRLHAGLGAMGGIRGVELAARGFTGPSAILEGSRGFFRAFADTIDACKLTDGLGTEWELLDCAIKPYCSCGLTHAPIDALVALVREEGLSPDDLEEVVVGCDRLSLVHVGKIGPHPTDMTGAQFSMEFSLAMAVVMEGNDFSDYSAAERAGYRLPDVTTLAERIRLELDNEADGAFPEHFYARVRVRHRDGRWLERTAYATGSPDAPMDGEAVRSKFRRTAEVVVGGERADAVERAVARLAEGAPGADVLAPLR